MWYYILVFLWSVFAGWAMFLANDALKPSRLPKTWKWALLGATYFIWPILVLILGMEMMDDY